MSINGDLTTKDVIDRFQAMEDRYASLMRDVCFAFEKLEKIRVELESARNLYEKSLFYCLKKILMGHPKLTIIFGFVLLLCVPCSIVYLSSTHHIAFDGTDNKLKISPH